MKKCLDFEKKENYRSQNSIIDWWRQKKKLYENKLQKIILTQKAPFSP